MKKNIGIENEFNNIDNMAEEQLETSIDPTESIENDQQSQKGNVILFDFSICNIISIAFIIILIVSVSVKVIFPTIDSIQANIQNRKVGKSIVYNFYNLLENSNYSDALKLIDSPYKGFDIDALTSELTTQLGTTNIVGCDILDVVEQGDQSQVNTIISYLKDGQVKTANQSMLLKNTPEGWKISFDGLVKDFKVKPLLVTVNKVISFTPLEIEYCKEGINLKMKVKNNTYKSINFNGIFTLETTTGGFKKTIDTVVKSKVQYNHNILFTDAEGEPRKLIISLAGKGSEKRELPLEIVR